MKKYFMITVLSVIGVILSAAPEGWNVQRHRAQAVSLSQKQPIIVAVAGKDSAETGAFCEKLAGLKPLLDGRAVTLYIELPSADKWSKSYRRELQKNYPFLTLESGIPLPAIYATDSNFNDLKVNEPQLTVEGFRKMLNTAQNKFAAGMSAAAAEEVQPVQPEKIQPAPKTEKRKIRMEKTENNSVQSNAAPSKYTTAAQEAEAERQRRNNQDPAGDPPRGWFTDPVKAQEYAAARKLPIMILFSGTDWCGPCKGLRRNVLDKHSVQKLVVDKCVALYIHVPRGGWNQVRQKYPFWNAGGVPSFVFTDDSFQVISRGRVERSYSGLKRAIKEAAKHLK